MFDFGSTKAKITDFDPDIDLLVFKNAGRLDFRDVKIRATMGTRWFRSVTTGSN